MKHSWTGGQYSAWRALFGLALAVEALAADEPWPGRAARTLLALALAAGIRDRLAGLLLAIVASLAPWSWPSVLVLLLHAATHGSPYGTVDARGRADPGGNWILPRWNLALRRVAVVLGAIAFARGQVDLPWYVAAAIALAACDPGWIPRRRGASPTQVFYDGHCGLCHRFVRLVLAEDLDGRAFRFAPLDSAAARAAYDAREQASLPDSVVVRTPEGETLVRSRGALHVLARLGGMWRLVGALLGIVPRSLLDAAYDVVARVRHRIFGRTATACPIEPPHLAARFDP